MVDNERLVPGPGTYSHLRLVCDGHYMRYIRAVGFIMLVVFACSSCRIIVSDSPREPGPPPERHPHPHRHPETHEKGPPPWAPAHGYRRKHRYYYFPRYNFYFDKRRRVYIYYAGKGWSIKADIPLDLREDDLRTTRKVQLEFSGDEPYERNRKHRKKYKGRKRRGGPPHGRGKGNG